MNELSLGQKIKKARLEKSLTQQEVVGTFITRNMLSQIENNVSRPSIKTIEFLANRLEKPISYFLEKESSTTEIPKNNLENLFEHSSFLFKNKEYKQCIDYLEVNLNKRHSNKNSVYYARSILILATSYLNLNEIDKGITLLETISKILNKFEDYYYLAQCYFQLSYAYHIQNKFDNAEEFLKKSINFLNKSHIGDTLFELKLYFNLGYAQFELEKFHECKMTLTYSLKLSKQSSCYYNSGKTYMLLGLTYKHLDDIDNAIYSTKKAIEYFSFEGENLLKAGCQKNIGNLLIVKDKLILAREFLLNSLEYYLSIESLSKINAIKSDLLEILFKESKYLDAINFFKDIDIENLSNFDKANLYKNLGMSYAGLENYNKALEYLYKASKILGRLTYENHSSNKLLHNIFNNLAKIYSQTDNYKEAYNYSNKAQVILEKQLNKK